jgi:hypothetical protein
MSTPALAAILVSYVIFCGLVMYFCVIADPNLSPMAYMIQVKLPDKLWASMGKVMGKKQLNVLQSFLDLGLVFVYLFVVLGCYTVVFWYIYPWIDNSNYVGKYHKYVGYVVFVACVGSWRMANTSSPGIITFKTFPRYDHYPYDNLMFLPNRRCETTNLIRIPRSKFDRLKCNQNVPRYDHFCGWVFNTIGAENYRWFLLFLLVHVTMCVYGSAVCTLLFWGEVQEKQLLEITFFDRTTGEHVPATWWIITQYLFSRKTLEFAVLLVMFVMGIALGGFLGYHMYITSYNRTTNEDGKWSDIRKWYKKELKKYQEAVKKGLVKKNNSSSNTNSAEAPELKEGDVSCTGGGSGLKESGDRAPEYFDPGPMPKNVYDKGFIENWKEVIFPISLRKEALEMGGYTRPNTSRTPQADTAANAKAKATPPVPTPSDKTD